MIVGSLATAAAAFFGAIFLVLAWAAYDGGGRQGAWVFLGTAIGVVASSVVCVVELTAWAVRHYG